MTKPPSSLMIGSPGTGKTTSLATLPLCGLETFVLVVDPNGVDSLLKACDARGVSIGTQLHYKYTPPATVPWKSMISQAESVNMTSYEALANVKLSPTAGKHKQFIEVLKCLSDFTCDCCNASHGAVDDWDDDKALAIDSLSGVNKMCYDLMVGGKATAHQGEWGVSMSQCENFLTKIVGDCNCFVVVTGHIDKSIDPVHGGKLLMVSMLGNKLAPKVPRIFSNVIATIREGANFHWSTVEPGMDLKTQSLTFDKELKPDFATIVEPYRKLTRKEKPVKAA